MKNELWWQLTVPAMGTLLTHGFTIRYEGVDLYANGLGYTVVYCGERHEFESIEQAMDTFRKMLFPK